nr:MAG TPA: hypothetical protein [Caudoviricetes sp.]DAT01943.1 MAG TPA: hypothetical protein [Caudoviricetes sp.]
MSWKNKYQNNKGEIKTSPFLFVVLRDIKHLDRK